MPLETDSSRGFEVKLTDQLNSGIWFTDFDSRIPLWADGDNIRFTDFGVEKLEGRTKQFTTAQGEPIRGIIQTIEGDEKVAVFGDLSKLYKAAFGDTSETTIGSGYTGVETSGATTWDATWDSGGTTWDEGVNKASVWSFVRYGSFIFATNNNDVPQVRKLNVEFNDLQDGVTGVTITAAGTGYSVSDPLVFTGGGGSGAAGTVTQVGGGGEIEEVTLTASGSGYTSAPTISVTGAGTGETLTASVSDLDDTTVLAFVNQGPHILAFGLSSNDKKFRWCSADDTDLWTAASTNTAGSLVIREATTGIQAVSKLGNAISVYTEDQLFLVRYVGLPNIFGYAPALDGIGAVSSKAVVGIGSKNYGLSSQGFFVTDGVQFQYIDDAIRDEFLDNISQTELPQVYAYHHKQQNEIEWSVPYGTSYLSKQFIYNYVKGTWGVRTTNLSSMDSRNVFTTPLSGDKDGNFYTEADALTDDGSPIVGYVRTKAVDFDDADTIKEITSVRIGYKGSGLQFRLGQSDTADGTITWQSYQMAPNGFEFKPVRIAGRYLFLELYSDQGTDDWDVQDITVQGRFSGTR